ncbi:MAG: type II toxin-antitoxin system VapC family toxin [Arcicella sp.]|jgi:PIN domain nuclease of toxin-antitoxin system|nr:type II toxin-antitoxin system VapC family toxin [Arcicella sp.]
MNILLDTHVVIWLLEDDDRLSNKAKNYIANVENEIFVSIISLFEIAIKVKIGKLSFSEKIHDIVKELDNQRIKILPLSVYHLESYQSVPLFSEHRDPFDRILIATALQEQLSIITIDDKFENYKHIVDIIW